MRPTKILIRKKTDTLDILYCFVRLATVKYKLKLIRFLKYVSFSHWWEIPHLIFKFFFFFWSHRWFLVNQNFIIERLSNSIRSQPLYHCSAVVHSFETAQLARTRYLVHLTPNINGPLYIN